MNSKDILATTATAAIILAFQHHTSLEGTIVQHFESDVRPTNQFSMNEDLGHC